METHETRYTSKFSLGDSVVSKKTGLPAYGTVVSIATSSLFLAIKGLTVVRDDSDNIKVYNNKSLREEYSLWTGLYPNWMFEPIITVRFNEPQHPISFEEWKAASPLQDDEEISRKIYEATVPKTNVVIYPEADLEHEE